MGRRDHRLRLEFPRPHPRHCRLFHRPRRAATISGRFAPGFTDHPRFGDISAAGSRDHAAHCGLPGREPIQGEAGRHISARGLFRRRFRQLCTAHNVMLILDEIQTPGLAATGKLLAEQHDGIEADVRCSARALSGGLLSGVGRAFQQRRARHLETRGQHGFDLRRATPLACAVARGRALRVAGRGRHDRERRRPGSRASSRGCGASVPTRSARCAGAALMLAIELHPEAGAARRYCEGLQARGILAKDTHDTHHPHRAAARHPPRTGRLGAGADRGDGGAGFFVSAARGSVVPALSRDP